MSNVVMASPTQAARMAFEAVNQHSRPTLETLTEDISYATGLPFDVRVIPRLGRWGAAALWLGLEDRHLLLESAPVSRRHQGWVRTHEFGHIVFDHLGWADPPAHAVLDSDVSLPDLIKAARKHRLDFHGKAEQAAEEFARHVDTVIRSSHGGGLDDPYRVYIA